MYRFLRYVPDHQRAVHGGRYHAPARNPIEVDLVETPSAWLVTANLPGVPKKDMQLSTKDSHLFIEAKRGEPVDGDVPRLIHERHQGRMTRVVPIPGKIDLDNIRARLENGVLTVSIPKERGSKKPITID